MSFGVRYPIFSSLFAIWCSTFIGRTSAACYFPDYLQGDYVMQMGPAIQSQVRYTEVISITQELISNWGYCYRKIGNDSYLIESMNNNSYCLRCFHLSIKSPNVLVVRTSYNPEKCFISQPGAENSCPKAEYLDVTKQMILYKTRQTMRKESCPFNGRYMVRYRQNKPDHPIECTSRTSDLSNCPIGSDLRVHFQDCPLQNHDLTFECLGTWNGPSNQQYLALYDTRAAEEERPQYRCGLYLEDSGNGIVYIAFSSDSTCHTDLKSSQSGFETLVLTPYPNLQFPPTKCRFPSWMAGRWELVTVDSDLNLFTYRDNILFTTYTFQCLNYDESNKKYDFPLSIPNEDHKILVYGRTHCGEELYTCLWIKFRGPNVFEFQLGKMSSPMYNETLCSFSNFQSNVWITQARRDYLHNSPCPIVGEYFGTVPNAEGLCAKLSSDCLSLDTMYYSVSDCGQQIFEDKRSGVRRHRQVNTDDIVQKTDNTTSTSTAASPTPSMNETVTLTTVTTETFTTSTPATGKLNDSLAVEANPQDTVINTETMNVRSYFVENKNLPASIYEDARFNMPGKTFLPPPVSSSTLPPVYQRPPDMYYNQYERPAYRQPPQYNPPPLQISGGNEYYQSEEHSRGTYYQEWNKSRPMGPPNRQPNNSERRTVFALPPRQLPALPSRVMLTPPRRQFFEDREYRCLGQWQENGLTYTFTERRNIGTFECFVGWPLSETGIVIREAGRHCERSDPPLLGMELTMKSSCVENRTSSTSFYYPSTQTVPTTVTTTRPSSRRTPAPTKPWRPIRNITRSQGSPSQSKTVSTNPDGSKSNNNVPSQLLILFLFYWCYSQ